MVSGQQEQRVLIKDAFALFDRDNSGKVVKEEIGTIMRYLKRCPSEEEINNEILTQLMDDDDEQYFVQYEKFEQFMLNAYDDNLYPPEQESSIVAAFKVLDPEGNGYLEATGFVELLTSHKWAFRDKELQEFLKIAKDAGTDYIYYEDYLPYLLMD